MHTYLSGLCCVTFVNVSVGKAIDVVKSRFKEQKETPISQQEEWQNHMAQGHTNRQGGIRDWRFGLGVVCLFVGSFFATYLNHILSWEEFLTKIYCGCHRNVPRRPSNTGTQSTIDPSCCALKSIALLTLNYSFITISLYNLTLIQSVFQACLFYFHEYILQNWKLRPITVISLHFPQIQKQYWV